VVTANKADDRNIVQQTRQYDLFRLAAFKCERAQGTKKSFGRERPPILIWQMISDAGSGN
jgi:hypothetical protein